ncbi:MAG: diguanylate cyclase [Gammaproteobacteria bacterium]|nr:diguanylate cyclase [Gammaproteobacteria bacterium]
MLSFLKKQLVRRHLSPQRLRDVLLAGMHTPYFQRHRASVILDRLQLMSTVFAALTLIWIPLDLFAFSATISGKLVAFRIGSSLLFLLLAWPWQVATSRRIALLFLAAFLINPMLFFLMSQKLFAVEELFGFSLLIANLYGLLPIIIIAGLSIFPLTAFESLMFSLPVLVVSTLVPLLSGSYLWEEALSAAWILLLAIGVFTLSGMIQLHYMISLISQIARDGLTGAYTRQTGQELIDLYFHIASERQSPFAIAFIDLDHFKGINDNFGHDAGDAALRSAATVLLSLLRRGDMVIRWGGEEFVVLLNDADRVGIDHVLQRITSCWLGVRPDGAPLTASIGVAEMLSDNISDWPALVELADSRMYLAKTSGRARAIGLAGQLFVTKVTR